MMATDERAPGLIAREQLLDLSDQLGPSVCHDFLLNFIGMWNGRLERLRKAVAGADDDAAMDVVLSIKISSQMAGAARLAALAACAEKRLVASGARELAQLLIIMADCGRETMSCLRDSLD